MITPFVHCKRITECHCLLQDCESVILANKRAYIVHHAPMHLLASRGLAADEAV